jgi:hypothetical protein
MIALRMPFCYIDGHPIVDKLSDREIVAVSAYLASKSP